MKNNIFMDNLKHFIEYASTSLNNGKSEEIEKLMLDLNEVKENTKLHFCANGILDIKKTVEKQRKKEKKLLKQEKKAKKLSSKISRFPNYIEIVSDVLFSALNNLDTESLLIYNIKERSKLRTLWLEVTDKELPEEYISNSDLFVNFIKQHYEVIETSISNDSDLASVENEKVTAFLDKFKWSTSSAFTHKTHNIHVEDNIHILLRKKVVTHFHNRPTLSQELLWEHKEDLDLDLSSALAKRIDTHNRAEGVYPTLIFVDSNDVEFFNNISPKDDIYNVDLIRKLVETRDSNDFSLNELDSRFRNVSDNIFVIYDRNQGLQVQEHLTKLSEVNNLVHVVFIDREGKSSKSVLNMINEKIASNFYFHFISNKMRALPMSITKSQRNCTLTCAGVDSLLLLRKTDRNKLSHISVYRNGNEELKYIPKDKLDAFGYHNHQRIDTTMIVARDWDDFMKKSKLALGIRGRTN